MNILAIETSTKNCSVALYSSQKITQQSQLASREQAQLVLPMIDSLLSQAGIAVSELNAIALSVGPGSFTGLRLGIGVAQGLSLAHNTPVIPISSLAVWAQAAYASAQLEEVAVAVNAHMNEVYLGYYGINKQKVMNKNKPDALIKLDEFITLTNSNNHFIGDVWEAYSDLPEPERRYDCLPDGKALLNIALKNLEAQKVIDDVSINYLRNQDAWKTTEQQINDRRAC
ncbi:MAG: tRNA (adenosine(37)-N6)-threonylcarbamoyltransferase complex dimerization subunit type 1 TsaB [Legionellaceae bacterium]|nr:tRNA (adenosine(37)-N6)-threonylcarbamoyltransferase complex dimerization subunit type 1 TsaB [Legionellaceae bacterium]|tara:strand:+ start:24 stop:707 length:684 start_codon:yes stop_codon:yes gene_type:complete